MPGFGRPHTLEGYLEECLILSAGQARQPHPRLRATVINHLAKRDRAPEFPRDPVDGAKA